MARVQALLSFTRAPWPILFALAGLGLIVSVRNVGSATLPAFCGSGAPWLQVASDWRDALQLVIAFNPPALLLTEWALMLLAMMPPLLAMPIMHVYWSSLPRRRVRALACFTAGYGLVWLAAGPILITFAVLLRLAAGGMTPAFAGALLIAVVWSACPWQRGALNRGHRMGRVGLFGWAADRECLTLGVTHAFWCVASCWPWMLLPLEAGPWHMAVMVLAGAAMLSDRLSIPQQPRWRPPGVLGLIDVRPLFYQRQRAIS
jgi:predicted metal-binding integral membrane protein DUF2182